MSTAVAAEPADTVEYWKAEAADRQTEFNDLLSMSQEVEEEQQLEIDQLNKKVNSVSTECDGLRSQLTSVQQRQQGDAKLQLRLQTSMETLTAELESVKKSKQRVEQTNDELQTALRIAEQNIEDLQHKVDGALEQVILAESEREEFKEQMARVEQERSDLVGDITALKANNNKDNQIKINKRRSSSRLSTGSVQSNGSNNQAATIDELNDRVAALQEELDEEMERSDALSQELSESLESAMAEAKQSAKTVADIEATNATTSALLQDKLSSIEQERNELMERLENLNQKHAQENEKRTADALVSGSEEQELQGTIIERQRTIDTLQEEVSESRKQVRALQTLVDELKEGDTANKEALVAAVDKCEAMGSELLRVKEENSFKYQKQLKEIEELNKRELQSQELLIELNNREVETQQLLEKMQGLEADLLNARNKEAEIQTSYDEQKQQNLKLEADLLNARQGGDDATIQLKQQIQEREAELLDARDKEVELQASFDQLQERFNEHETDLLNACNKEAETKQQLEDMRTKETAMSATCEQLKREIQERETDLMNARKKEVEMQTPFDQLQQQVEQQEQDLLNARKRGDEFANQLVVAESQVSELKLIQQQAQTQQDAQEQGDNAVVQLANERLTAAELDLENQNELYSAQTETLQLANERLAAAESELEKQTELFDVQTETVNARVAQLCSAQEQLSKAHDDFNAMEQRVADAEAKMETKTKEYLKELDEQEVVWMERVTETDEQCCELEKQLADAATALTKAQSKTKELEEKHELEHNQVVAALAAADTEAKAIKEQHELEHNEAVTALAAAQAETKTIQQQYDTAHAEIKALQHQHELGAQTESEQVREMHECVGELELKLSERTAELDRRADAFADLKQQLDLAETSSSDWEGRLNEHMQTAEEQVVLLNATKEEVSKAQQQLSVKSEQVRKLSAQVTSLQTELEEKSLEVVTAQEALNESLTNGSAEEQTRVAESKKKMEGLQELISEGETALSEAVERSHTLQVQIEERDTLLLGMKKKAAEENTKHADTEQQLEEQSEQITVLGSQVSNLQTQLEEKKLEVVAAKEALNEAQTNGSAEERTRVAESKKEMERLQQLISEGEEALSEAVERSQALQLQIEERDTLLLGMKKKATEENTKHADTEQQLEEQSEQITALGSQVSNLQTQLEEKKLEVVVAKEALNESQTNDSTDQQTRLDESQKKVEGLQQLISQGEEALTEAVERSHDLQVQIEERDASLLRIKNEATKENAKHAAATENAILDANNSAMAASAELELMLKELNEMKSQLEDTRMKSEQDTQRLNIQVETERASCVRVTEQLQLSQEDRDVLKKELNTVQNEMDKMLTVSERTQTDTEPRLELAHQQLATLEKEIAVHKQAALQLDEQSNTAAERVESLEAEVIQAKQQIEAMTNTCARLEQEKTRLETQVTGLSQGVSAVGEAARIARERAASVATHGDSGGGSNGSIGGGDALPVSSASGGQGAHSNSSSDGAAMTTPNPNGSVDKTKKEWLEEIRTLKKEHVAAVAALNARMREMEEDEDELLRSVEERQQRQDHEAVPEDDEDGEAAVGELQSLRGAYTAQLKANSALLARVQALAGNVVVYCRVRPFTRTETDKNAIAFNEQHSELVQGGGMSLTGEMEGLDLGGAGKGGAIVESLSASEVGFFSSKHQQWRPFAFDRVFSPTMNQRAVAREIADLRLSESVVGGVTCGVIAYGQTGSGKTYTMDGPDNNINGKSAGISGVNATLIHQVFHLTRSLGRSGEGTYSIRIAVVEIYNEAVRDLLVADGTTTSATGTGTQVLDDSNSSGTGEQKLKVSHQGGGISAMAGLTWQTCESLSQVNQALKRGKSNRATAGTNMNEHSSRSHSIVIVEVRGVHGATATAADINNSSSSNNLHEQASTGGDSGGGASTTVGLLYLVDLAGSERVNSSKVTGERLDETKAINKSLSALGDVMQALDKKSKHVPYRNSKLTHMLQPALDSNARTVMILTVPPSASSANETLNSLKFAQRVRNIELGPAQKRIEARSNKAAEAQVRESLRHATSRNAKLEMDLTHARSAHEQAEKKLAAIKAQGLRSKGHGGQAHQQAKLNDALNREMSELRSKHLAMRQRTKEDAAEHERERNQLFSELKATKHLVTEAERGQTDLLHKVRVLQNELTRATAPVGGVGVGFGMGDGRVADRRSSGGRHSGSFRRVGSLGGGSEISESHRREYQQQHNEEWEEAESVSSSVSKRLGLRRTPIRGGGYSADTVGSANKRRMSVGSAASGGSASVSLDAGRRSNYRRRRPMDDSSSRDSASQPAMHDDDDDEGDDDDIRGSANNISSAAAVTGVTSANNSAEKSIASAMTEPYDQGGEEDEDSRSEESRHKQGQGQRSRSGSTAFAAPRVRPSTSRSLSRSNNNAPGGRSRSASTRTATNNASATSRFLQAGSGAARLKSKSQAALAAKKRSKLYAAKQQQQREGGAAGASVSRIPTSFKASVAKAASSPGVASDSSGAGDGRSRTATRLRAPGFAKRSGANRIDES